MSREQELGLDRNRKQFDVRAEYFVRTPYLYALPHVSLNVSCVCVEIECDESGGLGTEAYRAAQGPA